MLNQRIAVTILMLLSCVVAALLLIGCEVNYHEAGRDAGELYNEAATGAAADPTAAAEWRATEAARVGKAAGTVAAGAAEVGETVAVEVGEKAPTVAAEVGEHAPTVAAEAATAAHEFSEGAQESGACGTAAMVMIGGSLLVAVAPRRGR